MDVSLLIRLIDQASGPAKKIAESLGGIGNVAGEMKRGFGDAIRQGFSVENIEQATKNAESALTNARSRLLGAFGMAITLAAPVIKASQFDQSMRGLDKVLDVTTSRLAELRKFALDTSALVPIAAGSLIELMSEAAQGGVPEAELEAFSLYVARAAVAFDMAGAEIGERFAKLRNVYKLNQDGIENLGDATNHLSNNMAAKASELTDFANRAAGAAAIFKLTATQTTAVGAAMVSAGIVPESAARGFTALATRILGGGKEIEEAFQSIGLKRKTFMKELEQDAPAALQKLFTAMSKSPEGMQALMAFVGQDFTDDFAKLIGNPELLAQAFQLVADKAGYAGSATDEAAKQAEGATKKWELFRNKIDRVAIIFGERLLPHFFTAIELTGQLVDRLADFADANPKLASALVTTVAGLMAFSIAGRLLAFAVAAIRLPLIQFASLFLKFKDGRNIALGWRMMAGAGRALGAAVSGASQGLGLLIGRLGGLGNTLRAGVAAGWIIPLAFEFIDDMGRTPEQRLEQIKKNHAAFKQMESQVDDSNFGQGWQWIKDSANAAMGLEAGQVPAEVFQQWLSQGWDRVDAWWVEKQTSIRESAGNIVASVREGLATRWAELEAWVSEKATWLQSKFDGFSFSFDIDWPEPPKWLLWLMDRGGDAVSATKNGIDAGKTAIDEWWNGTGEKPGAGAKADNLAKDVSGGMTSPTDPGGPGLLSDIWSGIKSAVGLAGDDLSKGGERGGQALQRGGEDAARALSGAASDIRAAASAINSAVARSTANAGRSGSSASSAISNAKTGALHGGTE